MPESKSSLRSVRCLRCGTKSPENTIQCISCGNVVLAQYDHIIPIAVVLVLLAGNFVSSAIIGYPQRSEILREVTFQMFPAIAIVTLLFKFAQKLISPTRNVVQEAVGLYSGVGGRLLIIILGMLVVWFVLTPLLSYGDSWLKLEPPKVALIKVSIGFAIGYLLLYFSHLGTAFLAFNVRNAITVTSNARLQLRRNAYIKKLAGISAIHKLQQNQNESDSSLLSFFAKGYAHQFEMTPEQGERMLQSVDQHEFSLFEAACRKEILHVMASTPPVNFDPNRTPGGRSVTEVMQDAYPGRLAEGDRLAHSYTLDTWGGQAQTHHLIGSNVVADPVIRAFFDELRDATLGALGGPYVFDINNPANLVALPTTDAARNANPGVSAALYSTEHRAYDDFVRRCLLEIIRQYRAGEAALGSAATAQARSALALRAAAQVEDLKQTLRSGLYGDNRAAAHPSQAATK